MITKSGLDLIRRFEGLRLAAYQDSVGVWTIGYGHTPAQPGQTISSAQAEALLRDDADKAAQVVARLVTVPISQDQLDALTSFVFNLGGEAFRKSTLLKKLNAQDYAGAANEFGRWVHAGGKVLPGLVRRRAEEAKLFGKGKPMLPLAAAAIQILTPLLSSKAQEAVTKHSDSATGQDVADQVVEVAKTLTGQTDPVEAAIAIRNAPEMQDALNERLESILPIMERIAKLDEASRASAREFNISAAQIPAWKMPALWVTAAILLLAAGTFHVVLTGDGWTEPTRVMVVQAVIAAMMAAVGFWVGSSHGSQVKDWLRK